MPHDAARPVWRSGVMPLAMSGVGCYTRATRALLQEMAERRSLDLQFSRLLDHPPCVCDRELVRLFQRAAREQQVPFTTMPSGAGHDSQQMARGGVFLDSRHCRRHPHARRRAARAGLLKKQMLAPRLTRRNAEHVVAGNEVAKGRKRAERPGGSFG
jgi:hypothetical protein